MLGKLFLGAGATALVALLGAGCAAQNGAAPQASDVTNSTGGSGQYGALVNQGRFPAPIYSQEAQPAYALTGEAQPQPQSWAWAPSSGYYQAGNARIFIPPTPGY